MDRRQRKSREAIFFAFADLLAQKDYHKITVGQIIEKADVGRATFYAHFETKEYLLKAFCQELFCHIFDAAQSRNNGHRHIFHCQRDESVFLHLFRHLLENDNHILTLLRSPNNELFLTYFRTNLNALIEAHLDLFQDKKKASVPQRFWVNHIATTFVETLRWWIDGGMVEAPEQITRLFFHVL